MEIKNKIFFLGLVAILILVCFTPFGSIPIGPIVATTSMIPVIVTVFVLGFKEGIIMGFLFGLFSFLVWTFIPPNPALAFLFTPFYSSVGYNGNFFSLIICFIPRVAIAVTTYYVYVLLKKMFNKVSGMVVGSFVGSFTNTILVMLFILLFFKQQYENVTNSSIMSVILLTITTNGILEAIMCTILCPVISNVLNKIKKVEYQ